jgi:cytochrome P450/GT2 family glycosyltransferase
MSEDVPSGHSTRGAAPYLTVIVPVLDGGESFEQCLEALERSTFHDWELVVVDDGSTDRSAEIAGSRGARLTSTKGRAGPGAARNTGVDLARGECVLFLDSDCAVHPDTLERVVSLLRADERVDAVFGSYDDEPAARGIVSRYRNLLHHWVHQRGEAEASTFWAGCGAIRRRVFESIGGFDADRYPRPSIEDIDLGVRLRAHGARIVLARDIRVKHFKRWTLFGALRTDALARAAPWTELALRSGGFPRDLNVNRGGRASVIATFTAAASLVATPWWPWALALSVLFLAAAVAFNLSFYRFLARKEGLAFALLSIPLHWFHFLAAGAGFALGLLRHVGGRLFDRRPVTNVPTAEGAWPLLGHIPPYIRDRLGFLRRAARDQGPIVRLRLGGEAILLDDPDDIQHVLVQNHANYVKSPRMLGPRARRWAGQGLLTATGRHHLELRRTLQPAFHTHAMARYEAAVLDTVDEWLDARREGEMLDVAAEMMKLTQRATGRILFSADFAGRDAALGRAIAARRRFIHHVFLSPLPRAESWPLPTVLRYRRAIRRLDREVYARIAARRASVEPPEDLLAVLTRMVSREGRPLTDRQVRDEAVTLSITGWETVGEALSWAWLLLGRHAEVAARLGEEADRVLESRRPMLADLPALRVAAMVRDEVLRLYPPTWIYVRSAIGPDVLPSGARVATGTKLYLCPWVTHRNPRHFPDPDRFDPDRFAEVADGGRPPAAFFPFGKGPHVCLGEPLARMEIVLALARIAQRVELETASERPIVPDPGITLSPRGGTSMRVRIRARTPSRLAESTSRVP